MSEQPEEIGGGAVHDEAVPHVHARTAFMVLVDATGKAVAILEPPAGVVVDVPPDPRAVKAACIEIADDIQARNAAIYVESALQALVPPTVIETPADAVKRGFKKRSKRD